MVSIHASSEIRVDRIKPKTMQLIFAASLLNTHNLGERAKTYWLEIRLMCPSAATCLPAEYCYSEVAL